jgi:hypothetical protein
MNERAREALVPRHRAQGGPVTGPLIGLLSFLVTAPSVYLLLAMLVR